MAPTTAAAPVVATAQVQGRASRAAQRRRGVVPNELRQRLDRATGNWETGMAARLIAGWLDGLHPSALTDDELREAWGPEFADPALRLLEQVGYGAPPARRARAQRAHGLRREARLKGVLGKLPRALALRVPTSAYTHRTGRNDGTDRWGSVKCSRTLRSDHLGLMAAVGGLWHARAAEGEGYVDVTAGELVQLLTGRRRVGGKDVVWVHGLLADLETLELRAEVQASRQGASEAHLIPSSPIALVERRVGDRLVPAGEYGDALATAGQGDSADLLEVRAAERADCPGIATIRIHLAAWVRDELAHRKRRPKLARAEHHRQILQPEIKAFREADPVTLRVKSNLKHREATAAGFVLRFRAQDPPDSWGLIAGDSIQNIRATLDHAVWAVVVKEKGTEFAEANAPKIDFPISDKPSSFPKGRLVKIGVPQAHIAVIEQAQPYVRNQSTPREDALWFLRALSNVDKHRLLHVIALFPEWPEFTTMPALPGFDSKFIHKGALQVPA